MRYSSLLAAVGFGLLTTTAALADDWVAVKLRGPVLQLIDKQWVKLERGMVVPDDRVVRTMSGAQVQFQRGEETIDLSANTQIQIHDRGTATTPNTTVQQYFGTVAVEAQVEQVKHFAVQTPYMAAVVKGTRFTVTSGKTGANVSVQRGHVAVEDRSDKSHVTLSVGQSATIDQVKTGGEIVVAGTGDLPVVLDKHGKPLGSSAGPSAKAVAEAKQTAAELAAAAKAAELKAKELKTPEAKAAAEAAKKAADAAKKEADQASKDEKKAADEAQKAAKDAAKDAEKASKEADKAAKDGGSSGGVGSSGGGGDAKDKADKPDKPDKPDKADKPDKP